jgi:hypothetical protein
MPNTAKYGRLFHIRMSAKMFRDLRRVAKSSGMSASEYIRGLLGKHLSRVAKRRAETTKTKGN